MPKDDVSKLVERIKEQLNATRYLSSRPDYEKAEEYGAALDNIEWSVQQFEDGAG